MVLTSEIIQISARVCAHNQRTFSKFKTETQAANSARESFESSIAGFEKYYSPSDFITVWQHFDDAAIDHSWTSGPKLFQAWSSTTAREEWRSQVADVQQRPVATFTAARNLFARMNIPGTPSKNGQIGNFRVSILSFLLKGEIEKCLFFFKNLIFHFYVFWEIQKIRIVPFTSVSLGSWR